MRCPRCGNENPATNRFCGMCGATMLAAPAAANTPANAPIPPRPAAPVTPVPPAPKPVQPAARPAPPTPAPSPSISGPSFLGLNQPPAPPGRPMADPHGGPSRNLDYLLEDDEPHHGGAWKIGLILVALLLAVGMGYLRWRNQGFGWLGASSKKPSASQTEDGSTPPPSNSPTDNSTAANPSAAPSQPAPDASASSNPPSLAPANGTAPASSSSAATPNPPAAANPAPATPSSDAPAKPSSKPSADPKDKDKDKDEDADADEPDANQPPVPRPKPAAVKPPKPVDPVSEAEKYLYGKGAPQNCDRGMKLLKPAADRGNPKAMSEMGALYSAGLCAPKDLPTAYHWFALALRKTPDDRAVQADMQKVWGEMTQPERQLAIRQSQ